MKAQFTAPLVALMLVAPAFGQEVDPETAPDAVPARTESIDQIASDLLRQDDPDMRVHGNDGELSSEPGSLLVLRGLDKVTAETRDFEIPIGETAEFGALRITAQYCRKRPPEETPETYAFLEITDRRTDGFGEDAEGEKIFSGWMFASRPAQRPTDQTTVG